MSPPEAASAPTAGTAATGLTAAAGGGGGEPPHAVSTAQRLPRPASAIARLTSDSLPPSATRPPAWAAVVCAPVRAGGAAGDDRYMYVASVRSAFMEFFALGCPVILKSLTLTTRGSAATRSKNLASW